MVAPRCLALHHANGRFRTRGPSTERRDGTNRPAPFTHRSLRKPPPPRTPPAPTHHQRPGIARSRNQPAKTAAVGIASEELDRAPKSADPPHAAYRAIENRAERKNSSLSPNRSSTAATPDAAPLRWEKRSRAAFRLRRSGSPPHLSRGNGPRPNR